MSPDRIVWSVVRAASGWCFGIAWGGPFAVRAAGAGCQGFVGGVDEAGLVGDDGGLDAVADVQAGEDRADVGLDGAFDDVEARGDLGVGQAGAEQGQDVAFPGVRAAVRRRARAPPARRPPPISVMTRWATFGDR